VAKRVSTSGAFHSNAPASIKRFPGNFPFAEIGCESTFRRPPSRTIFTLTNGWKGPRPTKFLIELLHSAEFYDESKEKPKIPRPPNAFMLYANENRKKMSQLYPTESNKDISKRLGNGWKSLNEDERKKFFERAKAIGLQHKKEYPGICEGAIKGENRAPPEIDLNSKGLCPPKTGTRPPTGTVPLCGEFGSRRRKIGNCKREN
jgi:hypothetical protein